MVSLRRLRPRPSFLRACHPLSSDNRVRGARSVELFTITCTTCRARLKVRELAAIGQILACPKCESMVQVVPPPGWQPPTEQPARSAETASASTAQAAGPGSTISLYATPKSDKPRVAKPATAADTGKDRQQAAAAAASIGAALPSGGEAPAADVSAGAVPPASTGALQSIVELSRQHWIVAALAPAACLAIVIGGWMAWRGTTRPLAPDEDLTVAAAPEAPKSSAPAVDAHSAEARPHTYWWWLPSQAVVVIRIPLGELRATARGGRTAASARSAFTMPICTARSWTRSRPR